MGIMRKRWEAEEGFFVKGKGVAKGSHMRKNIPSQPRSRSVPDVAVLNSLFRFLRNCSLSADVFQGAVWGYFFLICYFIGCSVNVEKLLFELTRKTDFENGNVYSNYPLILFDMDKVVVQTKADKQVICDYEEL
jgi:hypothetical protein